MNKIFTLLCAAAMAAPMVSADNIKMSVYEQAGAFDTGYTLGAFCGNITCEVTYNAATASSEASGDYTIANFLGYKNANVVFHVLKDYSTDVDGVKHYAIEYVTDGLAADNIVVKANNFKIEFKLTTEEEYDPGFESPKDPGYQSGEVTGAEDSYKFVKPVVWGCHPTTPEEGITNMIKRSYAIEQGDGYKFCFNFDSVAKWVDSGEGFEFSDYPTPCNLLVFSYPASDDPTGIADVAVDENAPVEYYNLQGVRVENPAQGLYIRRQGDKVEKVVIR